MSIKTKKQALDSIHHRSRIVGGRVFSSYVCYVGTDPVAHKKIMFERASKEECAKSVSEFFDSLNRGAAPAVARSLTTTDYAELTLVRSMLAEAGAAGTSLVTIVRDYLNRVGAIRPIPLPEAYERYMAQFPEIQVQHRRTIKMRVLPFVRAFSTRLTSQVGAVEAAAYFENSAKERGWAPKTFNEHRDYVSNFFSWACRKDVALCADNPIQSIRVRQMRYEEPEYVTADTVRKLFDGVLANNAPKIRNEVLAYLAFLYFAGVRTEEILRIRRKDVNLAEGWVRIAMPKGFQRGICPRVIQLTDAALAWLRLADLPTDDTENPLFTNYRTTHGIYKVIRRAAHAARINLPQNAGRHSFITMHVALCGDPAKTEAIAGTSRQMRVKNYMGLATRKQAEEYFSVLPQEAQRTTL